MHKEYSNDKYINRARIRCKLLDRIKQQKTIEPDPYDSDEDHTLNEYKEGDEVDYE